jgi:hypothetical protein
MDHHVPDWLVAVLLVLLAAEAVFVALLMMGFFKL